MDNDYQMIKIVIIGSSGTGKTSIATCFIRNQFSETHKATVGVQFLSKIVKVGSQNIKVTLWDTAGQQRYKSMSKFYYKGASGVLIVYDVNQPQTYVDVQSWLRLANQNLNLSEVVVMIVGNKIDQEINGKVANDRALKDYKEKFGIDCWQVSAKTGYNVKEVFAQMMERIYEKNIEAKSSTFNEVSDHGSVDTVSVFGGKKAVLKPSSMILQEVIVPDSKHQTINPANNCKNVDPSIATSYQNPWKPQHKPIRVQPKANKVELNPNDEKKRIKQIKEKQKGCC